MNKIEVGKYYRAHDKAIIRITAIDNLARYEVIVEGIYGYEHASCKAFEIPSEYQAELKLIKVYNTPLWKAINE